MIAGSSTSVRRVVILGCLFLATALVNSRVLRPERVPVRGPLGALSSQLGDWTGVEGPPIEPAVLETLGVDDYVNRVYRRPDGAAVALYIGYYQSQRQGDSIHSPLNCLPGSGWQVESRARSTIVIDGQSRPVSINRFVIQKGLDRQLVLYWYQSHDRVEASEYWSKGFLIWDAIRHNRSDAALVRVIAPIPPAGGSTDEPAARATAFVDLLFPRLQRWFPS